MAQLPPSPFISNPSVIPEPPTEGPAVALSDLQPRATAELFAGSVEQSTRDNLDGPTPLLRSSEILDSGTNSEPTSSTGGPQGTPASAPSKNPDAGVLATDHIDWHAFFDAVMDERIVLFELYDEVPLFLRDGDHLRRWTA